MKFHEDILNDFQVRERTRFCDRQTDGRPWQKHPERGGGGVGVGGSGHKYKKSNVLRILLRISSACFLPL